MKVQVMFLVWLAGCALVSLLVVEGKSCKGVKDIEKKDCVRKGRKAARTRMLKGKGKRRGHKKEAAAPYWRKGRPKDDKIIIRQGSNATLTCPIRGSPNPTFKWSQHNKVLSKKVDYKRLTFKRHRLFLTDVQKEDMGNYTCRAQNKHGYLGFTFTLRVLENMPMKDIDIVDRPENQTSQVGDTVIFLCRSRDWPAPKVYWARKRKDVVEIIKPLSNASSSNVLVLHNVTKADSGEYICFIGNDVKHEALSATLTIIEEGEQLPFEPSCSLHVRRQILTDHKHGCKTSEPVEIHYCMGSCGRSYFVPHMMTSDALPPAGGFSLNQTCSCCIGVAETLRIVELDCPLGQTKSGFYPLLTSCLCKPCKTEELVTLPSQSKTP